MGWGFAALKRSNMRWRFSASFALRAVSSRCDGRHRRPRCAFGARPCDGGSDRLRRGCHFSSVFRRRGGATLLRRQSRGTLRLVARETLQAELVTATCVVGLLLRGRTSCGHGQNPEKNRGCRGGCVAVLDGHKTKKNNKTKNKKKNTNKTHKHNNKEQKKAFAED